MTDFTKRPDGLLVPTGLAPAGLAPAGFSRRGFLAGTAVLGLAAGLGGTLTAKDARAEEPKRGGQAFEVHAAIASRGGSLAPVMKATASDIV